MGFGIVTGITCIVRTSLTYQITKDDLSWIGVGIAIAKMLEVNFGIIAACLPLMKPLYTFIRSGKTPDRATKNTKPRSSGTSTPWRKHRSTWTAKSVSQTPPQPQVAKAAETDGQRLWTWHKNVPNMLQAAISGSKDHDTQDTGHSLGLPLQGIRKTTEFGVERSKGGTESGIEMEEFV